MDASAESASAMGIYDLTDGTLRVQGAQACHICAGTGLTPATSAPGLCLSATMRPWRPIEGLPECRQTRVRFARQRDGTGRAALIIGSLRWSGGIGPARPVQHTTCSIQTVTVLHATDGQNAT